jgi:hypothetical protein
MTMPSHPLAQPEAFARVGTSDQLGYRAASLTPSGPGTHLG